MSLSRIRRAILTVSLVASFATAARAATAQNDGIGYAFDLPAGWIAIPTADVDRLAGFVSSRQAAGKFKYVAAYQLNQTPGKYFTYPYVLVQVTPYPNGQHVSSVSESELRQLVSAFTGLTDQDLRQGLSAEASKLVSQTAKPTASYFTTPPGFRVNLTQNVSGIGTIRGEVMSLVGRDHIVAVNFYTLESEWDTYAAARQEITSTFHLDSNQAVSLGAASTSGGGSRILSYALGGAAIGGIVGLFGWLFKRK